MDYRFAQAFLATARHQSFSKAARDLKIAQSAVSRQIRLLEESLGQQLFFRSSRNVSMTDSGKALFSRLNEFDQWVQRDYLSGPVEIRLAALDGVMSSHVIPAVAKMDLPQNWNVRLIKADPGQIEALVHAGEVDLAVSYQAIVRDGFQSRMILRQQLVLISKKSVRQEDLAMQCWIHMGNARYLKILSSRHNGREIIVNNLGDLVDLVAAGAGVGVVPAGAVASRKDLLKVPLDVGSKVYLIHRNYTMTPEPMSKIIEAIRGLQARK